MNTFIEIAAPGRADKAARRLRILQIAPLWETVPPPAYGGTEAVVHQLVEGLVARGHDITLWASGDSTTSARLRWSSPRSLRTGDMLARGPHDWLHIARALEDAARGGYDLVHNHAGELALTFLRLIDVPALTTMHYIPKPDTLPIWNDAPGWYNTLSRSHRHTHPRLWRPRYAGYVYNGIDTDSFPFSAEKDNYLLFLSRIAPAKAPHLAVDVARRLGKRLVIAGKVDRVHRVDGPYFERVVQPLIDGRDVMFEGEVDNRRKLELYQRAQALLLPLQWDEPFGLVIVEAMACGTPVIAFNRGAAPELIAHGLTGYIVHDVDEMAAAAERVSEIDPFYCRAHVRERFDTSVMTERYLRLYEVILASSGSAFRGADRR